MRNPPILSSPSPGTRPLQILKPNFPLIQFLLTRATVLFLVLLAPLPTHAANFSDANRWTSTATNGILPGIGSPMTLTWSSVPDGSALGTVYTAGTGPNAPADQAFYKVEVSIP
jgi:hypothetical protein